MTAVDVAVVLIVVVYTVIGFYTGVIRRVVGFLALFLAFGAATYLSPDGGRFLVQAIHRGLEPADARVYAFVGFLALVIIVVEGLAAAYHPLLQFSYVMLDRATGAVLGLVTGVVFSILVVWVLNAMGSPANANPTLLQTNIRDAVNNSALHSVLLKYAPPIRSVFQVVLPAEPEKFFSPARNG